MHQTAVHQPGVPFRRRSTFIPFDPNLNFLKIHLNSGKPPFKFN